MMVDRQNSAGTQLKQFHALLSQQLAKEIKNGMISNSR